MDPISWCIRLGHCFWLELRPAFPNGRWLGQNRDYEHIYECYRNLALHDQRVPCHSSKPPMHAGVLINDQGHSDFETITLTKITDNSGRGKMGRFWGPHSTSLSQSVVDLCLSPYRRTKSMLRGSTNLAI
ncbi:hypothetical protein CY34DRAFT_271426 [Suillus luteus UH-Slu-Lm8-n1]|uniref:Uncharacterized protein n=1 Tax=Suillus luteus UH-Slu-Lm8-n1 TaxID=930992 RepID=A0A0D0B1M0_9AGAM|nr:hypothetical protein CY34DRAFT_271426 [Suillus luteus UH-Slu-Lm8-n1]